jgi:sterol 3beta-glucosyltransferase
MPSHVTILAAGTRGDIQPFVALGRGLRDAGHDVTLAANTEFRALVHEYGVPFRALGADWLKLADTEEGREALHHPLTASKRMRELSEPMVRRMLDDAWAAAQDTDAIVYHPKTMAGPHLSERLGVPAFVASAVPVLSPTRAFPMPGLVKRRSLGGTLNHASYRLAKLSTRPYRDTIDAWRGEVLDLPPAKELPPLPTLYAYSEAVVPRPSDWSDDTFVTGYWNVPPALPPARGWTPDPALASFLAAGPAPVYVGFGSMPVDDIAEQVVSGLRQAGVRGLIAAPVPPADDMFAVGDVPHHWLFEHVAAVVHHGGAGTTGAGLRAGRPTVIVPQGVDQPFWAHRVHAIGAAPAPVRDLRHLGDGVSEALGDPIARRTSELGRALRREDGVATAVRLLEAAMSPTTTPRRTPCSLPSRAATQPFAA